MRKDFRAMLLTTLNVLRSYKIVTLQHTLVKDAPQLGIVQRRFAKCNRLQISLNGECREKLQLRSSIKIWLQLKGYNIYKCLRIGIHQIQEIFPVGIKS